MAVIELPFIKELLAPSYARVKINQYQRENGISEGSSMKITPHFAEWYEEEQQKDKKQGINIYKGIREKYLTDYQIKEKRKLER